MQMYVALSGYLFYYISGKSYRFCILFSPGLPWLLVQPVLLCALPTAHVYISELKYGMYHNLWKMMFLLSRSQLSAVAVM